MGFYDSVPQSEIERLEKFGYPNKVSMGLLDRHEDGFVMLDAGCGANPNLAQYAVNRGCRYFGIDSSETMVNRLRQQVATDPFFCRVDVADVTQHTGCESNLFDIVHARFLLMHLPDISSWVNAVLEMFRVLKPSGTLYLLDWDWETLLFKQSSRLIPHLKEFINSSWKLAGQVGADLVAGQKLPYARLLPARSFDFFYDERPCGDYAHELVLLCKMQADKAQEIRQNNLAETFQDLGKYFGSHETVFHPPCIRIAKIVK